MISIVSSLAILVLTACLPATVNAVEPENEVHWQKIKEKDDVTVYAQNIRGSDVVKVKTEVLINAGMEEIKSILDDLDNRKNWVPYLKESRVLKRYSDNETLEYSLFLSPWMASNRDFVYQRKLLHRGKAKIIFAMNVKQSELMPEQDGVVRADLIESKYTLTALSDKQTRVELVFHADPKGWLPDWVINIIQKALPFIMLRNLKATCETALTFN